MMHGWLGIALFAVGLALIAGGVRKRHVRMRTAVPPGALRPEFAAMGQIVRPLISVFVAYFGLKMALFYFVVGGDRYLTPLDFAGIMFVLAAYLAWLFMATTRLGSGIAAQPEGADTAPSGAVTAR